MELLYKYFHQCRKAAFVHNTLHNYVTYDCIFLHYIRSIWYKKNKNKQTNKQKKNNNNKQMVALGAFWLCSFM